MVDGACDVVVAGCGIAGLSAAASALQQGLSVVLLERAPREDYGGNTRWTEANMRMKNEGEIADDFESMLSENAGYNLDPGLIASLSRPYADWPPMVKAHALPDPEIIATLAAEAAPTLAWLQEFGIRFDRAPSPLLLTVSAPRIRPVGGGLALIEALSAYAHANGADIRYDTTAHDLLLDADGTARGVMVRDATGRRITIEADAVVLACGGFQGNPEMLAHYIGRRAEVIRPVARGGWYNKGEGVRMGLRAGAAAAGAFSSFHGEPVDPRSAMANSVVYNYTYGILVNKLGKRFIDEAPGTVDNHYDNISRTIADQPDGLAYVIYDKKIDDVPNWKRGVRTDHPAIEAPTLAALAKALEVPADGLIATVQEYNAACTTGAFKPLEVDHLSTEGLYPPKSNWARPLDQAPFAAYPIMCGNCFTFGGLKTNSKAQVLDTDGRVIHGLYAAGETMGIYHQVYTGATSVLRGAVFGRIAGLTIAAAARGDRASAAGARQQTAVA